MLAAESCHESLAFVVCAQTRTHKNMSRHRHSAVLLSRGGEKILVFVVLMASLILSGFPGLGGQKQEQQDELGFS